MSENWILSEQKNHIFEITLNRPEKRNAIQIKLLHDLADCVDGAQALEGVRLIVIRAAGKAFSAGLDVNAMGGMSEVFGENWLEQMHQVTRYWQSALNRVRESGIPTLVLIHGYCLGLGLEISLSCDFRYVAEDATMSLEETRLGMIPDVGGTTRLTQLVGVSRAKELILTGRRIDAVTAEKWGLANRVIAAEALDEAAIDLADEIAGCSPLAVAAAKRVIHGIADEGIGLHLEQIEQAPLFRTEDLQEGMQAAMERRSPQWKRR
jgi:enoyl-CoA hydratase/carnithine racemase